jgi:large subunit ribosomal protein L32
VHARSDSNRARPRCSTLASLMAVPKQKQSHSRTSKRRAQHKIAAPTYNACPTCHSPRLPHRVCPTCGSYAGREVVHVHATSTTTS